tara:strand:- start:22816 stop:23895 length:1080 start_codon:yes stop_codon:yes gene_type:complete
MQKNIFISGGVLSGKSTIIYLFDGHQDFLVNAIHLQLIKSFENLINDFKNRKNNSRKLDEKITFTLNYKNKLYPMREKDLENIFFESEFKHLEKYSTTKLYPNFTSALEKDYLDFNFDFNNFIKMLKDDLRNEKNPLSFEDFIGKLYYVFFLNWKDKKFIDSKNSFNKKYIVSKLPNHIRSVEFSLKEILNSKIIYVDRNIMGIMKSRVLHFIKVRNLDIKDFDKHFFALSKGDFFKKIKSQKKKIYLMKKKYPNRIFLTSLEAIVEDTENEMKKISNFLNVKFDPILTKITYLSREINDLHTYQINDDKYQISEKSEFFVNLMLSNWSYLVQVKKYFFIKYFKEVLISIYLKLKFFFN